MNGKTRVSLAIALVLTLAMLSATGAQAQILVEVLALTDSPIQFGPGTVRLDGMGGFETAVKDQNLEITLWDYVRNPAGFGDDRDSWSFDVRFSHNELRERDAITARNDLTLNDATLIFGYYKPRGFGVGGTLDYAEATHSQFFEGDDNFQLSGWSLFGNNYLLPSLSLGLKLSMRNEKEEVFSASNYNINHDGVTTRFGAGAGWELFRGITLGGLAEYVSTNRDGESRGPFHLDNFTWELPGWHWALHGFVDRGRLQGALDYSREDQDGREDATLSWSERFEFNPTEDQWREDTPTFSETRSRELLKTRWNLDVSPRVLNLSIDVFSRTQEQKVTTNQNRIGSLQETDLTVKRWGALGGVSWTILGQRLMLAGEGGKGQTEVIDGTSGALLRDVVSEVLGRVGVEYLVGETLVGRLGWTQSRRKIELATGEQKENLDRSLLSVGAGLVPSGGIWQFDVAYQIVVQSELDTDRSRFGAYLRYLF